MLERSLVFIMRKKVTRTVVVVALILIIVDAIALAVLFHNNYVQDHIMMVKVEAVPDDDVVKGNNFPKSSRYYDLAINGDASRSKPTAAFKKTKNQRIDVDSDDFDTYSTNDNTELHLKIVKPIKLKDQFGKPVHDQNYYRLIKHIVKYGDADLFQLSLFKTKKFYYACYAWNAGIDDSCHLLRYNPRTNKFKHMGELDGYMIMKVQELR